MEDHAYMLVLVPETEQQCSKVDSKDHGAPHLHACAGRRKLGTHSKMVSGGIGERVLRQEAAPTQ